MGKKRILSTNDFVEEFQKKCMELFMQKLMTK